MRPSTRNPTAGGGRASETFSFTGERSEVTQTASRVQALQWGYRDALQEHGDLLASIGLSLRESAYQGPDALAGAHLREARVVVIEATPAFKELEELNGRAG
jgi:hypothetical protein